MKIFILLLLMTSSAFAVPKRRFLAVDKAGCKIDYVDNHGIRTLDKRCGKKESSYFRLDDQSAPLLEAKEFRVGQKKYLGTRWATGKAERFYLFDLTGSSSKPVGQTTSEGPSSMSLDSTGAKVKVSVVERKGEGAEATASNKYVYFP